MGFRRLWLGKRKWGVNRLGGQRKYYKEKYCKETVNPQ